MAENNENKKKRVFLQIEVTEGQKQQIKDYCKIQGFTISRFIKDMIMEKIRKENGTNLYDKTLMNKLKELSSKLNGMEKQQKETSETMKSQEEKFVSKMDSYKDLNFKIENIKKIIQTFHNEHHRGISQGELIELSKLPRTEVHDILRNSGEFKKTTNHKWVINK